MNRFSVGFGAIGFLLGGLCLTQTAHAQQRRVLRSRETALSQLPIEASRGTTFLSPDGKRFVYVVRPADHPELLKVYTSGQPDSFNFSRLVSGTPLFSEDGEHLVVAGKDENSWMLIHDGLAGKKRFTRIWDDSVRLSARGNRVAFVAERSAGKLMVVVDEREQGTYDAILDGSLTFSPDGKHYAYSARNGAKEFVVIDDQASATFDKVGRPIFSPDGAHLAFVALSGGKWMALTDGKPGPGFDAISAESLQFAPDAERVAYVATKGSKKQAVVNGKLVGDAYPWVFSDSLVFSADARRFAFVAKTAGMMVVVVDGKEEVAYRSIVPASIRFSPDGKRVAYIAERPGLDSAENMRVLVIDGVEGKPYRWIRGAPVFSADSKRVACIAQRPATGGEGWDCFLVLDGIEGGTYPWIRGQPVLNADGSRAVFMAATPDTRFTDADEMPWNPDTPMAGGRLTLDSKPFPVPSDREQKALAREPILIVGVEERLTSE